MTLLSRLESKYGRYAPANVTLLLIGGQLLCFGADYLGRAQGNPVVLDSILLIPAKVAEGQVWRLVTFLFTPFTMSFWVIFAWYLFYLFGTTLEQAWGSFRYNVYLLIGYLASLAIALVYWLLPGAPSQPATNAFLYGSVFLAFARLNPDFTLMLMFILPVKVRWLALLTWLLYAYELFTGPVLGKMLVVAAVLNYVLFFGREIIRDLRHGRRRMQHQVRTTKATSRIIHKCRVCGLNSNDAPRTQFRYCSQCTGQCCYCPDHIRDHEHVVKETV